MPLDLAAVNSLLEVRPETTIDGDQADAQQVANRLNAMWPAGEPVVYIGWSTWIGALIEGTCLECCSH